MIRTGSGIPVEESYGEEHAGDYPFTRGIRETMYRGRLWTMRQYAGLGDAEASNQRYKFLLGEGTTGLSVAFDLPTQIGFDSDDAMALGEVGRVGVAIDSLEDMERLFAGIPLDRTSTSMTINATASILLAMYFVAARRAGVAGPALRGTVQNDILKEYVARGTYIYPVRQGLRLVTDSLSWAAAEMPAWNAISVSGYHLREAGATAVQELAFTLANARSYVRAAIAAGMEVDAFAPRLSFFFSAHNDLFEEVAKFRAGRRMWAKMMREEFGATDPRSWQMRFHTQTAGSTLTAAQAENNVVRTTVQALAGVLGGTQSLHTNGFDEALGLPTETAARIALRTQQVIAFESGVAATVDPLGGSYYVEALTDEVERRALAYLTRLNGTDEIGMMQREIQGAAYAHQRAIDAGETVVVGVNRFQAEGEQTSVPVQRIDAELERRQVERVRALRMRRDAARWAAGVRAVGDAARGSGNVMPAIVDAVEAEATVGEVADALRRVFGEYREAVVV